MSESDMGLIGLKRAITGVGSTLGHVRVTRQGQLRGHSCGSTIGALDGDYLTTIRTCRTSPDPRGLRTTRTGVTSTCDGVSGTIGHKMLRPGAKTHGGSRLTQTLGNGSTRTGTS